MDKSDTKIDLTLEEHELLLDILIHFQDSFNLAISPYELNSLPEDSSSRKRFDILNELKSKLRDQWSIRFD